MFFSSWYTVKVSRQVFVLVLWCLRDTPINIEAQTFVCNYDL